MFLSSENNKTMIIKKNKHFLLKKKFSNFFLLLKDSEYFKIIKNKKYRIDNTNNALYLNASTKRKCKSE